MVQRLIRQNRQYFKRHALHRPRWDVAETQRVIDFPTQQGGHRHLASHLDQ